MNGFGPQDRDQEELSDVELFDLATERGFQIEEVKGRVVRGREDDDIVEAYFGTDEEMARVIWLVLREGHTPYAAMAEVAGEREARKKLYARERRAEVREANRQRGTVSYWTGDKFPDDEHEAQEEDESPEKEFAQEQISEQTEPGLSKTTEEMLGTSFDEISGVTEFNIKNELCQVTVLKLIQDIGEFKQRDIYIQDLVFYVKHSVNISKALHTVVNSKIVHSWLDYLEEVGYIRCTNDRIDEVTPGGLSLVLNYALI